MTMGTASTMACMIEALGMTLPGGAAIPAADSRRKVFAQLAGRRIVGMVEEDLKISDIITREALENAIVVNAGVGGSTNLVIHLTAIAGRVGVKIELDDFDILGSKVPLLVNLLPSGKYLMEDFYYAGGLPVVINELKELLHLDVITANGKSMGENIAEAECFNRDVIATVSKPVQEAAGIVVLRGNLAENGAIIKPSAATQSLMVHKGKAVVFENIKDFHARVDDPKLQIDADSVMVLKNVGPKGYPGMAEVGNMPLPKKILQQGITDMVRISDGRMSGTAFGTVVLHVSPEAAVGGNLALVEDGDIIELDVPNRKLHLQVDDLELENRRKSLSLSNGKDARGYVKLYVDHVLQADQGADMDFLVGKSGSYVPKDNH